MRHLVYGVVAFREQRNIQNAVFCVEHFGRNRALKVIRLSHRERCRLFSERVDPRIIPVA